MKKRILAGFLTITVMLALSACKGPALPSAETDDLNTDETGESLEEVPDSAASEENTSGSATAEAEYNGSDRPELVSYTESIWEYPEDDEHGKSYYLEGYDQWLGLSMQSRSAYPKLGDRLDEVMQGRRDQTKDDVADIVNEIKDIRSYAAEDGNDEYEISGHYYHSYYARRVDEKVTSILALSDIYSGGAHGYAGYGNYNFDSSTGEDILIKDVIPDKDVLESKLKELLLAAYDEEIFFDLDEYLKDYCDQAYSGSDGYDFVWTFDPDGITFFFNPYDLAPYASGMQSVLIPYSDGLIDEKYLPDDKAGYIIDVSEYADYHLDVSDTGNINTMYFYRDEIDENDFIKSAVVRVDDTEYVFDDLWVYDLNPYVVQMGDGATYIYLDTVSDNDYREMFIVSVEEKDNTIVIAPVGEGNYTLSSVISDESEHSEYIPTDPEHLHFDSRMDILSTYEAGKVYNVSDAGIPVSDEEYYMIHSDLSLLSIEDLECDVVGTGDTVEETGVKIPAGNSYKLYRTDGDTFVDAVVDDGRIVRLYVEREDYRDIVNGAYAENVFDMLYYAG